MPLRQDAISDRRFWATLYAYMLGHSAEEPPEREEVFRLLDVREDDVQQWFDGISGWNAGALHASDGVSDDPSTIVLQLANGVELVVELHPGDAYWYLQSEEHGAAMIANIGPHWALPGLRLREALDSAPEAPNGNWALRLLLLQVTWITADDDVESARAAVKSAWDQSGFVNESAAIELSEMWVRAAEGGRDYAWTLDKERGWVCTAEWSTRGQQRSVDECQAVNRIIEAVSTSP